MAGMSGMGASKSERDFQAEDDLHRLMHAHEVTSDKKRHLAAKRVAKRKLTGLRKLLGGKR